MESVFPCWIWADLQLNKGILSGFWQKNAQTDLCFCTRQTWSYHYPTKFEFSVKLAYMQAFKTQLFCQVNRLYFGCIWALHIKVWTGLNPGPVCCEVGSANHSTSMLYLLQCEPHHLHHTYMHGHLCSALIFAAQMQMWPSYLLAGKQNIVRLKK